MAKTKLKSVLLFSGVVIDATADATSPIVDLEEAAGAFSVGFVGTGTGVDLLVEYQVSGNDGTTFDTTTTDPSRTLFANLGANYLVKGFDLPLARKVRIKVTGQGANPAGATVTGIMTYTVWD